MTRRNLVGALMGAVSVLLLSACGSSVTGESFEPIHYKITAVVETPRGLRSGHSVLEYRGSMAGSAFGTMAGSGFKVRGEAVAVEVAPGQVMFVLLRAHEDLDFAANALNAIAVPKDEGPRPTDRAGEMERTRRMYDRIRANRNVYPLWRPKDQRPGEGPWMGVYFVRFRDINVPETIEEVNPDDLASIFGKGVRLKTLTIQVTDEPVTTTIEKYLPWLKTKRGAMIEAHASKLPPPRPPYPFGMIITTRDFSQGIYL